MTHGDALYRFFSTRAHIQETLNDASNDTSCVTSGEAGLHMRVSIYARTSTDKGQDNENQLVQLRQFAELQGWVLVQEYVDEMSGKSADRPAFRRLFEAASRWEFDLVLFWSLDRFSREGVLQTLQHLQRLTDFGVGFRSYTESYPDSCGLFKDAVISILAVIAKQERIRTRERVLAGIERYRNEFDRGTIGKEKSSRSGKNLALGRPKRIFDRLEVFKLRSDGFSLRQIASKLGLGLGNDHAGIEERSKN